MSHLNWIFGEKALLRLQTPLRLKRTLSSGIGELHPAAVCQCVVPLWTQTETDCFTVLLGQKVMILQLVIIILQGPSLKQVSGGTSSQGLHHDTEMPLSIKKECLSNTTQPPSWRGDCPCALYRDCPVVLPKLLAQVVPLSTRFVPYKLKHGKSRRNAKHPPQRC